MDKATTAIRLEQWANIFREWSASGLNKTEFCRQRGIKEKLFFYYQRRLRNIVAEQTGVSSLTESSTDLVGIIRASQQQDKKPDIVRIPLGNFVSGRTVSFTLNGACFTVPEDIPASFLAKLLEAASHGSR